MTSQLSVSFDIIFLMALRNHLLTSFGIIIILVGNFYNI